MVNAPNGGINFDIGAGDFLSNNRYSGPRVVKMMEMHLLVWLISH